MLSILLPEDIRSLAQKLAQESEIAVEALLTRLIRDLDESRHSQFQPGRGFVRVQCGLPHCFEHEKRKSSGYGE